MKYYVELTLLPDADMSVYYLWERVYQQVHLALVEQKEANNRLKIGVSFPDYRLEKHSLGSKLRVFAETKEQLSSLDLSRWLARLTDYVHCKDVKEVPSELKGYGCFKRLFEKGSNERLARRRAKRLSISYDMALAYFESDKERKQSEKEVYRFPFITMKSLGSGEKYPLTIGFSETSDLTMSEGFSTYGLASKSSVPLF
ncbi:type I-F CRISPR-associated endoribonuclease Cas6/Csy4 [Leucothrix arctica]|uniref:Type I-F CRISPR-associated endoribonuclease Cas6/Csy4 n=1 Tax=Leucothrix arctica TaxID=1481894 RepID=A0A317CG62_9GAMM|nr:type I-F CRISPR-associated endoribonuclease Cas6/Csy4 [Leucothrix arctica]PWQ97555.1 type I-F CRISPR-associated endoribonuclease Cas6/Csy4 [Leucothrix arctica]